MRAEVRNCITERLTGSAREQRLRTVLVEVQRYPDGRSVIEELHMLPSLAQWCAHPSRRLQITSPVTWRQCQRH